MAMNSSSPGAGSGASAQQAVGQAQQAAGQAQQVAGQALDQAKQQASSQLGQGKAQAAEQVGSMAQALRQTGDQLRQQEQAPVAQVLDGAAQHLEQFSDYLRHTDINAMVRDVERFARRQPAAFLGGAFTIGVLAARFLKSSGDSNGSTTALARQDMGAGAPGYGPGATTSSVYAGGTAGVGGYASPTYRGGVVDTTRAGSMAGASATGVGRGEAGQTAAGGWDDATTKAAAEPVSNAVPTGSARPSAWGDQTPTGNTGEKEQEGR